MCRLLIGGGLSQLLEWLKSLLLRLYLVRGITSRLDNFNLYFIFRDMNFIFEVHLRRTTNPLGSRSNPEGSKIEPFWVRSRTQKGSKNDEPSGFEIEPRRVRDRTQRGSRSNPSGFDLEPSGFHEPRRVRRSNPPGFRTLLGSWNPEGSISNPEGFEDTNPSGFVEPRGFEERTLWVRGTQRTRTQKGSIFEPVWVRSRTQRGSISNPEGFNLRTLWVRSRTQRVRRSSKMNFEDELRR
ncbi:hypothetical protein ACOSQ3_023555 [Xanthoceras sorbifolium]